MTIKKRGRGRPRKSEIAAKAPGGRKSVGRPKGDTAIMNDYKSRMLASPKSEAIMNKVLDLAMSDDHPDGQACRKLVFDRLLPSSFFEKDKMNNGRGSIEININTSGAATVSTEEPIEGEFTDA